MALICLRHDMALQGQWAFGIPFNSEFESEDHDMALRGKRAFGLPSDSESAVGTPSPVEPLDAATPARRVESRLLSCQNVVEHLFCFDAILILSGPRSLPKSWADHAARWG